MPLIGATRIRCAFACAVCFALAACTASPRSPFEPSPGATLTEIRHVVLIDLHDSGDAPTLIADMDRLLPPIEGVTSYWRGAPHRGDRPEVRTNYDVALIIVFQDDHAYAAYGSDSRHLALLNQWRERVASLDIYDISACAMPDDASSSAAP